MRNVVKTVACLTGIVLMNTLNAYASDYVAVTITPKKESLPSIDRETFLNNIQNIALTKYEEGAITSSAVECVFEYVLNESVGNPDMNVEEIGFGVAALLTFYSSYPNITKKIYPETSHYKGKTVDIITVRIISDSCRVLPTSIDFGIFVGQLDRIRKKNIISEDNANDILTWLYRIQLEQEFSITEIQKCLMEIIIQLV